MQYVASEMQKDDHFRVKKIPLLIGGAHLQPRAHGGEDRAPLRGAGGLRADASRSVSVAQSLLSEQAAKYIAEVNADYDKVRELHANKKQVPLWPLAKARANKTPVDWSGYSRPAEVHRPARSRNYDLAELARYIDWGRSSRPGPGGPLPRHPEGRVVGAEAVRVFSDGQRMLKRLIEGRWLTASAVMGFWPANTVNDDDIQLYADAASSRC